MQQQQQNKRKTAAPPEVGVIQSIKVDIDIVDNNTGQIPGVNENPREMTEMEFKKLKKSLQRDAGYTAISELRLFPLGDRWVTIGGNMRLSKAARNYHPGAGQGPGVYRSSYKNAMRLARTEINMAYQAADNERWTKTWWVRGIEIRLSNNHTVKDSKGKDKRLHDICDELAGQYPPDFKFTGWHPQCRCLAVPLTASYADIREYYRRKRAGEDMTGYEVPGLVKHPPKAFTRWVTANSKRLQASAAAGRLPYFVANNPKYAGIANAPGTPKTDPVVPTPAKTEAELAEERRQATLAAANARHQARTPVQIEEIQTRVYLRNVENYAATLQDKTFAHNLIASLPTATTQSKRAAVKQIIDGQLLQRAKERYLHTLKDKGMWMAKESPVIAETLNQLRDAMLVGDGLRAHILLTKARAKCSVFSRFKLRQWGAIDNLKFKKLEEDHIIVSANTLYSKRAGKYVNMPELKQDLLCFEDQHGKRFYYTLGIKKQKLWFEAGKASEIIANAPNYARRNIKGIIFTDERHPLDNYYKLEYPNFTQGAMYSSDPVTVHCRYSDSEKFKNAIMHEIGHHFDLEQGFRNSYTLKLQWAAAQKADGNFATSYAETNMREDFAETFSYYVNHPTACKRKHPNRAAIIAQLINSNP